MIRTGPAARFWARLSLTAKLGVAFALLTLLIVHAAVVHYFTLSVVKKAEADILASMEIRQLVFEMDGGLEKARRLYRDFLLNYPVIGFDKARELYCQPLLAAMDGVIDVSLRLRQGVSGSSVSDALQKRDVDINLYLSSAKRFSAIFLELVDLVTALAEPDTGLFARLDALSARLAETVETSESVSLACRKMDLLAKQYRISRQRPVMQSVFNAVFEIGEAVAASARLTPERKAQARELLDAYVADAGKMLDVDVSLAGKVNDFALQLAAVDPISQGLKKQAEQEVALARERIETAGTMATGGIIATSAFGFACALAVAFVVNASVTRKITVMTGAARELRSGNLDARVSASGSDELGVLAESFNAMADRIRDLVENLERNVRQRTNELAAKNKELDEKNHALEILSMTDRLTGLSNRRKIEQSLQAELLRAKRYGKPYAVILLDVDRFKRVNDTFGHPAGDAVLVRLAGILSSLIRETDTAGRYGGEEFIVVCPETGLSVAVALAERLRQAIADTVFPPVGDMSASFGVTAYRPEDEVHSLVKRADLALYKAKQGGRNRVETVVDDPGGNPLIARAAGL
jgi:diguanylate cyclase (GGDEF)-like protein